MSGSFFFRLILTGLSLLLLGACSDSGYYLQAVKGQYQILSKRQPISELLDDPALSLQQRHKLSRILQIRNFAVTDLALPENDSYCSYVELDQPYPVWNLVATPEFSLKPKTWCFPVAGCVSYRGYFSESDARQLAQKLQAEGYDTLVAGVAAYSTLKWFDDPVLSSFSRWPTPAIARLIFHELAHQQLYLAGDSDFNEAFATSVALAGTRRWLKQQGSDDERRQFQQRLKREATFLTWAERLRQKLEDLYNLKISNAEKRRRKEQFFKTTQEEYQKIKASWNGYRGYDQWVKTLNNARLASLQTYRRLVPAFNALFRKNRQDFTAFYQASKALAAQPAAQRQRQLLALTQQPHLANGAPPMSITLTILCDNSVEPRPGLIGEHGFACHIATTEKQYLFDTGSGLGLLSNAKACGIDLREIDAVLLSHGHWDHCGGLLQLLKLRANQETHVYTHPAAFDHKISCRDGEERDIGAGFSRQEAEEAGAIFHLSSTPVKLPGGLTFSGEIPRTSWQQTDQSLYCQHEGKLIPDPLLDDQSLYLETRAGLSILCGCAHAGIRQIITHALQLSHTENLHALIGGLHLMFTNSEQENLIIKDLQRLNIQLLAASHCTGIKAVSQLINKFGACVTYAAAGRSFQI